MDASLYVKDGATTYEAAKERCDKRPHQAQGVAVCSRQTGNNGGQDAGIPLIRALTVLAEQTEFRPLPEV